MSSRSGIRGGRIGSTAILLALALGTVGAVDDGLWALRLERVLAAQAGSWEQAEPLFLELVRRDGSWDTDCWAHAPGFNKAEHRGRLAVVAEEVDRIALSCVLEIAADPWVPGGACRLDLQLVREDGTWRGTYTGAFREEPVHGRVEIRRDRVPDRLDELLAFEAEEHPRLLLRCGQMDRWREAAGTREGQGLLDNLRQVLGRQPVIWHESDANAGAHAAGHGLLYALTEAKASADAAKELVWVRIRKPVGGPPLLALASEVVGVSLAYDLCYHAWEPAFRATVTQWLETRAAELAHAEEAAGKVDAHLRWNAVCRSAASIASLAIARDPGHFPQRPTRPVQHHFVPPVDYRPPAGLGQDWRDGALVRSWLVAGPFNNVLDEDVLSGLGGSARLLVEAGTIVRYAGQEVAFRSFQDTWLTQGPHTEDRSAISLLAPVDRSYHSLSCWTTAIRFEQTELVRFRLGESAAVRARVYLGQRPIRDGDLCEVQPGWYPLTMRLEIGATQPWGEIWMEPRFERVARGELPELRAIEESAAAAWERAYTAWVDDGRQVVGAGDTLTIADRWLRRHLRHGYGDAGWSAEGDSAQVASLAAILPYLYARRHCSGGLPISDEPVMARALRCLAVRSLRLGDRVEMPGFGRGDHVLDSSAVFHLGWAEFPAGKGRDVLEAVRSTWPGRSFVAGLDPIAACFAFLQQPLLEDMGRSVALPQRLIDRRLGWVLDRGVGDAGNAVLAVLQGAGLDHGLPYHGDDAGSFRLLGLGRRWIVRGEGGATENRVYVVGARVGGPGRLLDCQDDPQRGVIAELDLGGTLLGKDGRALPGLQRRSWWADVTDGAQPIARLVIQDRCEVSDEPRWVLNCAAGIEVKDDRFTVGGGKGPSLVGTVVLPAEARLTVRDHRLEVSGGQRFLVVLTLQDGEAADPGVRQLSDGVWDVSLPGVHLRATPDGLEFGE